MAVRTVELNVTIDSEMLIFQFQRKTNTEKLANNLHIDCSTQIITTSKKHLFTKLMTKYFLFQCGNA